MKTKVLIVVDMQNDFITGSLGTKEAQAIVPNVVEKIKSWEGDLFLTQDTHKVNYLSTQEGKFLPIEHCIALTDGWRIHDDLKEICGPIPTFVKSTFGCTSLIDTLKELQEAEEIEEIQIIGLCTDICVISNALILKSFFPEVPIAVDANCCAGSTRENHEKALSIMQACQIIVER